MVVCCFKLKKLNDSWNLFDSMYDKSNHRKRLLLFSNKPSMLIKSFIDFSSPTESLILTGHGRIKNHLHKSDRRHSPSCRFCKVDLETIAYLTFHCQAFAYRLTQYHAFGLFSTLFIPK